MSDEDNRTLGQLAEEVLFAQNACNFTAIARSFGRSMTRLRHLVREGKGGTQTMGESDCRHHPITQMWMSKMIDLAGNPNRDPDAEEMAELRAEGYVFGFFDKAQSQCKKFIEEEKNE